MQRKVESPADYYSGLDFIHGRSQKQSGTVERAYIKGRARLPKDEKLESDSQDHVLHPDCLSGVP